MHPRRSRCRVVGQSTKQEHMSSETAISNDATADVMSALRPLPLGLPFVADAWY
jgi:hypothetical protein